MLLVLVNYTHMTCLYAGSDNLSDYNISVDARGSFFFQRLLETFTICPLPVNVMKIEVSLESAYMIFMHCLFAVTYQCKTPPNAGAKSYF